MATVCTELSWWLTGDNGGTDVAATKLAMVLFLGIVRDSDVAALVSVVPSSCEGLWEVDRVFDMMEMGSGGLNSEKGGMGSMSALNVDDACSKVFV